jgi:hypothetical protein
LASAAWQRQPSSWQGSLPFFTVGIFAVFSTGVTAFFGAGFAAAFVALVVAIDSSSLVKGWPETFVFA